MPTTTIGHGASHGAHAASQHLRSALHPKRASTAKEVEYTCPMHPQMRQMGPGSCPICGMALEPVVATADTGESPELRDMTAAVLDWLGAHYSCVCPGDGWPPD